MTTVCQIGLRTAGDGRSKALTKARRAPPKIMAQPLHVTTRDKCMTKAKQMIVAAQPEAAEVGATMLQDGGNAVDAAVACALVQGVVDPLMTGIAGFGSAGIYFPG